MEEFNQALGIEKLQALHKEAQTYRLLKGHPSPWRRAAAQMLRRAADRLDHARTALGTQSPAHS